MQVHTHGSNLLVFTSSLIAVRVIHTKSIKYDTGLERHCDGSGNALLNAMIQEKRSTSPRYCGQF